jgi:hypothetical protein
MNMQTLFFIAPPFLILGICGLAAIVIGVLSIRNSHKANKFNDETNDISQKACEMNELTIEMSQKAIEQSKQVSERTAIIREQINEIKKDLQVMREAMDREF